MAKKVLVAFPPLMLEQIDFIAVCEHRGRSDLIREALRRYINSFKRNQNHVPLNDNATWAGENEPK